MLIIEKKKKKVKDEIPKLKSLPIIKKDKERSLTQFMGILKRLKINIPFKHWKKCQHMLC